MKTPKPWVILLWGAPAAGKSTLARKVAEEYQHRTGRVLPHLGTDKLNRSVMGEQFVGGIRRHLYSCLINLAEGLLEVGQPVLLEATFLEREWRRQVRRLASSYNVSVVSAQVECRLALRESRNGRRSATEHVPESFLRKAHQLAKNQIECADFVFDTELNDCDSLARFLMGAVGVGKGVNPKWLAPGRKR
jgi:predicted kinase